MSLNDCKDTTFFLFRDAYLKNLENIWLYLSKNVPLQNYAIYTKYEGTVDGFV